MRANCTGEIHTEAAIYLYRFFFSICVSWHCFITHGFFLEGRKEGRKEVLREGEQSLLFTSRTCFLLLNWLVALAFPSLGEGRGRGRRENCEQCEEMDAVADYTAITWLAGRFFYLRWPTIHYTISKTRKGKIMEDNRKAGREEGYLAFPSLFHPAKALFGFNS